MMKCKVHIMSKGVGVRGGWETAGEHSGVK